MDRINIVFWGVIGILFTASAFFGLNAENQRRAIHHVGGKLENGDVVRLEQVIDGDTVLVSKENTPPTTVRILGIKAFAAKVEKDPASVFGKVAVEELSRQMKGHPVRVMLNSPPKDSRGRFLATLYVNDRDIGLDLVNRGLVLVYSVYPFPAMPIYLHEQELARAKRKGLWGDQEVKTRAISLITSWQEQQR